MIWVYYWLVFFGAMGIVWAIAMSGQDNRPTTEYDGIHKVRRRQGR